VLAVSRALTPEQRRIAELWADGAGTDTPPGHWNRIALELIRGARLPAKRAARVLAQLNTAQADAFVAAWDAKFAYWSERPVTAIRRELDPAWLPLLATPPFPSYVSGHATTSGAASEVLAAAFPREAVRLRALAEEAALSRLYAGIHFRSDNEAGLALGRQVAAAALGER
jgi:membrane-associated phospholipid phosphatase